MWFLGTRGVHPPKGNDAFSPFVSESPHYFRHISQTPSKIYPILPFPTKFSDFYPPKFLMTFVLVIDHKFRNTPPNFALPPIFEIFLVSLLFLNFPYFVKFPWLLHTFGDFRFPLLWPWCIYTLHNARTGRPCRTQRPSLQTLLLYRPTANLVIMREELRPTFAKFTDRGQQFCERKLSLFV